MYPISRHSRVGSRGSTGWGRGLPWLAASLASMMVILMTTACGSAAPAAPATAPAAPKPAATAAQQAPAATSQAPAAQAKSAKVVKFVTIQSLTGSSAPYGIRPADGATLAVKEINAAGGFQDANGNRYTLEITRQDMGNDRNEAVALARQAAGNQEILGLLGPANSVGFIAALPLVGQLKLPTIGHAAAPINEWNPWGIRIPTSTAVGSTQTLKLLVPKLGIKKLGLIYDQVQDAQAADAANIKAQASALGYQVVGESAMRTGDQDFSAAVAKMQAAKPDAIWIACATGDGTKVVVQLRDAGVNVPLITGFGSFVDQVFWDNSKGLVKDQYTLLAQDLSSGALKKFVDDYRTAFGELPTSYSTYGYDSVYAAVEAIKKSGATTGSAEDREKFRAAMDSMKLTTPIGTALSYQNPPTGENIAGTVTVVKVTGRGTYEAVK